VLAACGNKDEPPPPPPKPARGRGPDFTVLATSDLRDVQPLEEMVLKATGVKLKFRFGGTMESTEAVLTGEAKADAAWFANAKYLLASPEGQSRVKLQEKIMLSPIAVGVSESDARKQRLGQARPEADLEGHRQRGQGRQAALRAEQPGHQQPGLHGADGRGGRGRRQDRGAERRRRGPRRDRRLPQGLQDPGDNSTYLSEQFILQQGTRANAFINYESWLLSLNASGKLREKLRLIYPFEGVSTADYPFMLLDEQRRADYLKVAEYLKGEAAQTWLARQTLRRPIKPDVAARVEDLLPKPGLQVELPFSPDRALADGLIAAYLNEFRTPIASTFVLDTSGSMQGGGRRQQLVQAMHYIAGADASLTGRIAKLTNREKVWLQPVLRHALRAHRASRCRRCGHRQGRAGAGRLRRQAEGAGRRARLRRRPADEGRHRALRRGVRLAEAHARRAQQEPALPVLGGGLHRRREQQGPQPRAVQARLPGLPEDVKGIPVFWVLFGEANEAALKELAQADRRAGLRRAQAQPVFRLQGHPRIPVTR
jgi:Ca-activated chloride channel family protein